MHFNLQGKSRFHRQNWERRELFLTATAPQRGALCHLVGWPTLLWWCWAHPASSQAAVDPHERVMWERNLTSKDQLKGAKHWGSHHWLVLVLSSFTSNASGHRNTGEKTIHFPLYKPSISARLRTAVGILPWGKYFLYSESLLQDV